MAGYLSDQRVSVLRPSDILRIDDPRIDDTDLTIAHRNDAYQKFITAAREEIRQGLYQEMTGFLGTAAGHTISGITTALRCSGQGAAGARAIMDPGFVTKENQAVFWSGIQGNGQAKAAQWAFKNGGATLESTMAARGIKLPAYDRNNPASVAAWRQASQDFAAGASGHVRALQGDFVRVNSIWGEVEFPALKANPNVKSITGVNPDTGKETLLWER